MFESTQTQPRRGAISIGWLIEAVFVGLLIVIPLVRVQDLPQALPAEVLVAPPPPMGNPKTMRVSRNPHALPQVTPTPTFIPKIIIPVIGTPETALQAPSLGVTGGVPWGDSKDAWDGLSTGSPPPPPAPVSKAAVLRVRVGGQVEGAKLIFQVRPEYPEVARMARIHGAVRLEAVISKEGTVESLKIVSGPPLLVKAAFDAVAHWRYQPTPLNGEPVEVATEIEVNFTLGE
jgi:periplasmic protein TonB